MQFSYRRMGADFLSRMQIGSTFPEILTGIAMVLVASIGCMVGPKYQRPAAPVPASYKEELPENRKEMSDWKVAEPNDGAIRGKWWEIYGKTELNGFEEQINISNQNLQAAEAQFRAARDAVRIARSGLFPNVTSGASFTGERTSANVVGSAASGTRTIYDLPANLSYLADIWGSIRRSVRGSAESAQVSAAQLENVRLALQAELAQLYFQLRGTDSVAKLLEDTVESYKEYLDLTQMRFDAGVASGADVAQAQTQLSGAQAQLVDLEVARAQFEHAIAILIGKPPADFSIAPAEMDLLPPAIPLGVPSDLLERRPDIAAAERQMAAANEQIGIVKAAFYPAVTLSPSAGFQSSQFVNWISWPSRLWSLGPQLTLTAFDAGKRRAQTDQAQSAYNADVANYRQIVLTSFQQVEDNLAALRVLAEEARVQDEAVQAALQSLDISTSQYKAGTASYLQVITTQTIALQNRITAANILTRRMVASVLLIEALGGGWNSSSLPSERFLMSGK